MLRLVIAEQAKQNLADIAKYTEQKWGSAQKGNRNIQEGSVHSTRSRVVDINESSDWDTMGAVGDVPATLMQSTPHPWVRMGGYALDAADVLSIQFRVITTGQNLVTETYTHDTLWDARNPDPRNWTEIPGVRSQGTLIDTDTKVLWSNTRREIRTCLAMSYGCSPAW